MEETMKRLVLLGPPGAGKGTQAVKISAKYEIPHISTGDIFRKNIKEGTPLGKKAKEYMDRGELVPDDLVIDLVEDRLTWDDCHNGFMLDGFPRTIYQAERFDAWLSAKGEKLDVVLEINVPEEILLPRMIGRRVCKACGATYHVTGMPTKVEGVCDKCGGEVYQRDDDKEQTVLNRFKVYEAQTAPLIDYYEEAGNIAHVDGSGSLDKVFDAIVDILGA